MKRIPKSFCISSPRLPCSSSWVKPFLVSGQKMTPRPPQFIRDVLLSRCHGGFERGRSASSGWGLSRTSMGSILLGEKTLGVGLEDAQADFPPALVVAKCSADRRHLIRAELIHPGASPMVDRQAPVGAVAAVGVGGRTQDGHDTRGHACGGLQGRRSVRALARRQAGPATNTRQAMGSRRWATI